MGMPLGSGPRTTTYIIPVDYHMTVVTHCRIRRTVNRMASEARPAPAGAFVANGDDRSATSRRPGPSRTTAPATS